jgi:hypothetical protein
MIIATITLVEDFARVEFFKSSPDAEAFADAHDAAQISCLEDLADTFNGPQLVKVYNSIQTELEDFESAGGFKPTKRFSTPEAGVKRVGLILEALHRARENPASPAFAGTEPVEATPNKPKVVKPTKVAKRTRGVNLAPKGWLKPCREGSKQQTLLDLLNREFGVTMDQLREGLSGGAKPWSDATIKSGFNWDMNSVKGYGIRTEFTEEGEAVYFLVLPEGVNAPLPATPLKTKKKES